MVQMYCIVYCGGRLVCHPPWVEHYHMAHIESMMTIAQYSHVLKYKGQRKKKITRTYPHLNGHNMRLKTLQNPMW